VKRLAKLTACTGFGLALLASGTQGCADACDQEQPGPIFEWCGEGTATLSVTGPCSATAEAPVRPGATLAWRIAGTDEGECVVRIEGPASVSITTLAYGEHDGCRYPLIDTTCSNGSSCFRPSCDDVGSADGGS
jgi:hypothetical protein